MGYCLGTSEFWKANISGPETRPERCLANGQTSVLISFMPRLDHMNGGRKLTCSLKDHLIKERTPLNKTGRCCSWIVAKIEISQIHWFSYSGSVITFVVSVGFLYVFACSPCTGGFSSVSSNFARHASQEDCLCLWKTHDGLATCLGWSHSSSSLLNWEKLTEKVIKYCAVMAFFHFSSSLTFLID